MDLREAPGKFELLGRDHVCPQPHDSEGRPQPDVVFKTGDIIEAEGAEAAMMRASPGKFKELL